MAYRIEQNVSWRGMWNNLHTFLTEMTNIYDVSYESAAGDGIFSNLSVPTATATTEIWTFICTDASYPQTFSAQGNVTGNTATVTVDTPYDNGVIKFTLTNGSTPWQINDIISFSTETSSDPVWESLSFDEGPVQVIPRFYKKHTNSYVNIYGQFMHLPDGPKSDSCTFTATKKSAGTNYNMTSPFNPSDGLHSCITDFSNGYSTHGPDTLNEWAISFWSRHHITTHADKWYTSNIFGSLIIANSGNGKYSNLGVRLTSTGIGLYGRYNKYGTVLNFGHSTYNYFLNNPHNADDWAFNTINVLGDTITLFINGVEAGSTTDVDISELNYTLDGVTGLHHISDLLVWNKNLTISDMSNIIASPNRVTSDDINVIDCIEYDYEDLLPKIMVHNKDNNNNSISAVFNPMNKPYFSYQLSMSFRGIKSYRNLSKEEVELTTNNLYYHRDLPAEYPCKSYNYLLGAEPSHIVDKYWFIASNEFIIVAYKTYDPSTQQQLPVYQVGYIGKSKTIEEYAYKVHLGTSSTPSDYWYTGSSAFRSGVLYTNTSTWLGYFLYERPQYIGKGNQLGGLLETENSYNIYPITHHSETGRAPTWEWAGQSQYANLQYNENYGQLHNISGIQTINVDAEDVVIIDGVKHIALTDTTRAGTDSLILLKLD